jgi:hypothetical protein
VTYSYEQSMLIIKVEVYNTEAFGLTFHVAAFSFRGTPGANDE